MHVTTDYKNLTHTLKALKIQVIDSLPYMGKYLPNDIDTPEQLFIYLRSKFNYKSDPKGVELLQMAHTLLDRGGYGDCDCGTILTLASCWHFRFTPTYVSLVGKSKNTPSHIYSEVWDNDRKEICAMDLTNPYYNMERNYPYKQRLKFCL